MAQLPEAKAAIEDRAEGYIADLGGSKKLTLNGYKGSLLIHLREYYEKEGKSLPGKFSRTLTKFQSLQIKCPAIDIWLAILSLSWISSAMLVLA